MISKIILSLLLFSSIVVSSLQNSQPLQTSTPNSGRIMDSPDARVTQWQFAQDFGKYFGYIFRSVQFFCALVMLVDLVLRALKQRVGNGFLFLYRFVIFLQVFCYASVLNFAPNDITGKGFRGIADGLVTNFYFRMQDNYYGIGYLWVFINHNPNTEAEYLFINATFVEGIVYFCLILISLIGIGLAAVPNLRANPVPHTLISIRVVFVVLFAFYFVLHGINGINQFLRTDNIDFWWNTWSFITTIICFVSLGIELCLVAASAFASMAGPLKNEYHEKQKMKMAASSAQRTQGPPSVAGSAGNQQGQKFHRWNKVVYKNDQPLIWTVYKDLNSSFLRSDIAENDPISRLYNFLWILRWVVYVFVTGFFYKNPRTICIIGAGIHLLFLIYTIVATGAFSFTHIIIGIIMVLEELCLVLFNLVMFAFHVDEEFDTHMSFTVVWLFTIAMGILFFLLLLLEILLIIFQIIFDNKGEPEYRENYVPHEEDFNFKVEGDDLKDKVQMYQTHKGGKPIGSYNLEDNMGARSPRNMQNTPQQQQQQYGVMNTEARAAGNSRL